MVSNSLYGVVVGEFQITESLVSTEQLWEHSVAITRFVFTFVCLKFLKSEWPFEAKDMFKERWCTYLQNATYVLILTHLFMHMPAYSLH